MKTTGFSMAPGDVEKQDNTVLNMETVDKVESESTQRTGMNIVLLSAVGKMKSLWLPEPPVGKYRFENSDDQISELVYFEAKNGKWSAYCQPPACFQTQHGRMCRGIELADQSVFSVQNAGSHSIAYCEEVNSYSGIFHNYYVERLADISIGRSQTNDIVYPNMLVSQTHVVLKRTMKGWEVRDCDSRNGVYVNGVKMKEAELKLGDHVYIMGLRIIVGVGFISINDSNDRVQIRSLKLRRMTSAEGLNLPMPPNSETQEVKLFNRLPRKRKALDIHPISIEAPPMSMNANSIPFLLRMGGPMVMSSTALMAGHITSMLSSVLFPVLTQKYTDKQRKDYEEKRYARYTKHLEEKNAEIEKELRNEQSVLTENYPELSDVLAYVDTGKRLWERRTTDDDFMTLRIGNGRREMLAKRDYPQRGFAIEEDPLLTKMYQLAERPAYLENAPVLVPLTEDFVCGVLGPEKLNLSFVQRMIMQLCMHHSYDEVKIVVLTEEADLKKIEFVKYLPHIWNDQRDFRFLATNAGEAYQISEYLKEEIGEDLEKQRELKDILKTRPYYMVFALSKRIFDSMEVLKDVMQADQSCGVSVLTVFDDLPKECVKIFELRASGEHSIVHLKQIEKADEYFRMDSYDPATAASSMKKISNTSLKLVTQAYSLPQMVTFLEMFGVGRVEHLNPLKRWKENNPVKSLAAPVGVATDGSLFTLDLHEKYQGPHGLVAGMTGSGKSEFIITYILSMAINYHPDEVAFILIDYKGGGLADAFENTEKKIHLPHVVGTITNLDGGAIQRSLRSLYSEVTRRQHALKEAKKKTDEGTMDIYKYQKYYRNGQLDEPMPHLFIISDEFAELKQQKPEFMESLISIARIGRSLGVHLILATQKPSGVVNEQIRSNTKFRVCLKVQDKSDSQDMLKRSEAAELKDTGRFYLQVGYNEFFALGQSAWTGATYAPSDELITPKDDSVEFIDSVGRIIHKEKNRIAVKSTDKSQLVAVVQEISDIARQAGIVPRMLWSEQLPNIISLATVEEKYKVEESNGITALVGLVDSPEKQCQFPFQLDLQTSSNVMIAGESGSGKTTFLQTMLFSLVSHYSPEEVNFYIMDFSSRAMDVFRRVPHCGCVLSSGNETDIMRLFAMMDTIVEKRKKLFADADVNNFETYRKKHSLPLILIVIDGVAGFTATPQGKDLILEMDGYIKKSAQYGIKYIISCSHSNEIFSRVKQELGKRITLQLKDKYAYAEVLNAKCDNIPPEVKGRGLAMFDGAVLEYHTAVFDDKVTGELWAETLRNRLDEICQKYVNVPSAEKLMLMDPDEEYSEFAKTFTPGRIPLGYSLENKEPVALPLKQMSMLSLYFGNEIGVLPVLRNFTDAVLAEKAQLYVFTRKEHSVFGADNGITFRKSDSTIKFMECTKENSEYMWGVLHQELTARKEMRAEYCRNNDLDRTDPDVEKQAFEYLKARTQPIVVLFERFLDFCREIDTGGNEVYPAIFKIMKYLNVYMIAGFYPDDAQKLGSELLMQRYNPESMVMLFGGNYKKQGLVNLPSLYAQSSKINPDYRKCLMQYQGNPYTLHMPCGPLVMLDQDEDDEPIFR